MKKKQNKYKILLVFIIILTFFLILYFSLNKEISFSFSFAKDLFYYPTRNISNNKSDIVGSNINEELSEEIKHMKSLLNISETLSEFEKVNAVVISRNNSYWLNNITINKGKKDKIDVGMAVVVGEGLIGRIQSVTNNTAVVKLITSNDKNNRISVKIKINNKYIYKVLEMGEKSLIISGVDNDIKLTNGMIITTSGLSDIYPSGIMIGTIDDIDSDKYGISQKISVSSSVDFDNIRFVSILIRKA